MAVVVWIKWVAPPFRSTLKRWVPFVKALEVNTIMIDLTCTAFIIPQPIFESDLQQEAKVNQLDRQISCVFFSPWYRDSGLRLCSDRGFVLTTLFRISRKASFIGFIAFLDVGAEIPIAFWNASFVG